MLQLVLINLPIRLTGSSNNPIVYNQDYNFEIGKSIKLRSGKDVSLFALEQWSAPALMQQLI